LFRAIFQFSTALLCVAVAYGTYSLLAVPWIEGTGQVTRKVTQTSHVGEQSAGTLLSTTLVERYLPEDCWERTGCKILETRHGLVLFKDYEMNEKNQVVVSPFTLIATENGAQADPESLDDDAEGIAERGGETKPPILLRTASKAILFFEKKQSDSLSFGNLIGGQLPGDVEITRAASSPVANDAIYLRVHNIQIDDSAIITPHKVDFRFGGSHGSGRNLQLKFKSAPSPQGKSLKSITGITWMELAELDELYIETDQGSSLNQSPLKLSDQRPPASETAASISTGQSDYPVTRFGSIDRSKENWKRANVRCKGAFQFDFDKSVATFFDRVKVELLNEGADPDTLTAQQLDLYFDGKFFPDDETAEQGAEATAVDASLTKEKRKPQISKIVARGIPAELNLALQQANCKAEYLEFDVPSQKIVLSDSRSVHLRDPLHQINAPRLEYTLGEEGRIGVGWAPGPGRMEKFARDDEKGFVATWGVEMNVRPHDGKTAVSLYERAQIQVGDEQSFAANELHFWMWEFQDPSDLADAPKHRVLPAKILSTGNVVFETANLSGSASQIQGFWPPVAEQVATLRAQDKQIAKETNESAATNVNRDFNPSDEKIQNSPTENKAAAGQHHWHVKTGQANFYLDANNQMRLVELLEDFEIREATVPVAGENLVVKGNNLIMIPTETVGLYKMTVMGKPAVVTGRKQSMYANMITLDQHLNEIVAPGAGKMQLADLKELSQVSSPPDGNNTVVFESSPATGKSRPAPATTIRWSESLKFDGQLITVQGDANVQTEQVDSDGQTLRIDASAQRIKITLDQLVNLSQVDSQQPGRKPEVQQLDLTTKVKIHNETYGVDENLKAVDQVVIDDLMIQPKTGRIESHSAGAIETTRIEEQKEQDQVFVGEVISQRKEGLNYMQINFAAGFYGNLLRREMTFQRKVRAIYGPVSQWQEKLDANHPQSDPGVMLLDCDQLAIGTWQPTREDKATVEMKADGNVSVRNSTFRSISQRVSFHQASDLLIIGGSAIEPAKIWYQTTPNGASQYAEAGEIKYWHRRGQIAVDQLEKAEYASEPEQPQDKSGRTNFGPLPLRGR
jgi:hypothetical protein